MIVRPVASLALVAMLTTSSPCPAQSPGAAKPPDRAVRRDIPITNAIRRAFIAGTRDSTGRPGRNYWHLRTDYTISVRLDPATSRLTGRETIVIRNASPDSLRNIALRLDPNLVVTRMAIDGKPINLAPPAPRTGATSVPEASVFSMKLTSARIALANAIPAGASATLEFYSKLWFPYQFPQLTLQDGPSAEWNTRWL